MSAAAAAQRRHENLRGIVWMLIAVATLSLMDGALKWLSPHYPALEVAALRGLVAVPVVVAWALLSGGLGQVLRVRWPLHLLRGLLSVVMLACFIFAVRALPLADAYSIFFISPLLITALSVPLLGERVDAGRWIAIGVGLSGVLILLRPTGGAALTLAGLAAIAAAVCYSLSAITVRVLGRTDSTLSMVFWFSVMLSLGAGALALPSWVAVRADHLPALGVIAVTGAVGQYAITEAFRRGEASVVAPFEYSALAWGLGLDFALWGTIPDGAMFGGAAIIIGAGLYLVRRERVHAEAEHP
jgi:drug/metabolite transporter (DMT)-like permease